MPWVHLLRPFQPHRLHKIVHIRHLTLGQDHFPPCNTLQSRRLIMLTPLLSLVHPLTNLSTLTLQSSSVNMTLDHPIADIILLQLPTLEYDLKFLTIQIPFRPSILQLHIPHFLLSSSIRKSYHPTIRWFVLPVSRRVVNNNNYLTTNSSSDNHTILTLLHIDQNG